ARCGGLGTSDTMTIPLLSSYRWPSCPSAVSNSSRLMRRPASRGPTLIVVFGIVHLSRPNSRPRTVWWRQHPVEQQQRVKYQAQQAQDHAKDGVITALARLPLAAP